VSRRQGSAASTEYEMPTKDAILRIVLIPEDRRHEPTLWKSEPDPPDQKRGQAWLRLWRRLRVRL
jgi:hypothetical protein